MAKLPREKEDKTREKRGFFPPFILAFLFKVRRGGCEEIPLVQGKKQRLCFAGATVKRYPTTNVRETQVRR